MTSPTSSQAAPQSQPLATSSPTWLVCRGTRLEKRKLSPEETASLKQDWRNLNKEFSKDPLADKVQCSRCDKQVTRVGYIRHATLQGCKNIKVKWGNYVKIFQLIW